MVFMGASSRLHRTRRETYQHILEDVFQYHPPPPPSPPPPWVELKRRFEWSFIATDFANNNNNHSNHNHSDFIIPIQQTQDKISLPKQVKSNVDPLCFKSSAGRLTLNHYGVVVDAHQPDLEYEQRGCMYDDPTTTTSIASTQWINTKDNHPFSSPCLEYYVKDNNSFDHDLYDSRLLFDLTPSISSSSSSSDGSSSSWTPVDDEGELSLIHLAQDTLNYIQSFPTYSDELLSLTSKLDDYLDQSW